MPTEKPSDAMAEHRKTTKTAVRWFYLQSLVLTLILFFVHICRIPDDCIDLKRHALFVSRAMFAQLIEDIKKGLQ